MPRTKEFDPDAVLDRALELFWRRGYDATSTAELVEELGVARASLYATFGGKRDLYLAALGRYLQRTDADVVARLSAAGAALPAVRATIRRYADTSATDEVRRGCLVVNAAVELAARDPEVARLVEASWTTLETALTCALARAVGQGELAADRDPRSLARFLLVGLQGIQVLGRVRPDPDRIRAAADQMCAAL